MSDALTRLQSRREAINPDYLRVRFAFTEHLFMVLAPEEQADVEQWDCALELVSDEDVDDEERTQVIGTATVYRVLHDQIGDLWDALDEVSEDLSVIGTHLTRDEDRVLDFLGGDHFEIGPFLIVDQVVVVEEFRGLGLGQLLVSRIITRLSRDLSLAVLTPAPSTATPESGTREHDEAVEKLTSHWSQVGFKSYAKNLMIADLVSVEIDAALRSALPS